MKRNKYVFIFYWVIRVGLGNSYLLYITSTHSPLSVWSWRSCVGFHSLLLACRSGKNNSEGFFLRITASGYREMVLICQNISAYIIAFFFFPSSPSELVPVDSMCLGPLWFFFLQKQMSSGHNLQFPLVAKTTSGHQSHFLTHGLTWHCVSDAFAIDFTVWWFFVLRRLSLHICMSNCDLSDSLWASCCDKYWITEWTQLLISCMQDIILEITNSFQIHNEFILTLIWFSSLKSNISIWIVL